MAQHQANGHLMAAMFQRKHLPKLPARSAVQGGPGRISPSRPAMNVRLTESHSVESLAGAGADEDDNRVSA